jgi:hypothetical protein
VLLERRSRLSGCCIVVWRHGQAAEPGGPDASGGLVPG